MREMLDKESSGKGKRSSVAGTYENETATTRGIDENQRNQWSRLESLCLGSVCGQGLVRWRRGRWVSHSDGSIEISSITGLVPQCTKDFTIHSL
jgi:hypothetical protein